jgi:4-amino-4-deoxy-L-arabinose transferase-like glycosyltransferase
MALSGAIIAASVQCFFKPKTFSIILLFILTALAIYTKYNVVIMIGAIGILLLCGFIMRMIPLKKVWLIILPLFIGTLTIIPYLRFHNYAYTGKYLPNNADIWPLSPFWDIKTHTGYLRFFFKPPALTTGEWTDPYAFDADFHYELSPKMFSWAKRTYLSSVISTSLFGEYNYSKKVPSADKWAWITLWVQVALLVSISYWDKNVRAMSWFLLLSLFLFALFIRFSNHIFNSVNFRFFAWIFVPLSVLVASQLQKWYEEKSKKYWIYTLLITLGTIAHVLFFNELNSNLP